MPNQQGSAQVRAIALASAIVVALVIGETPIAAQIMDADVAADSELQLLERADAGAYQRYSITIVTRAGSTVVTTNKDGVSATRAVAGDAGIALWRELLTSGLESLGNASPSAPMPDQSRFTVTYRAGSASGKFTAYAVDSLPDARYRAIVRAVLAFADKHSHSGDR